MAWYDNVDTRGYNNMLGTQAWPEYNPNLFRNTGIGRFDIRNMRRPDNLTQDMGASTYTAPPVYPASLYSPHRGFNEMQFSETVEAPEKKGFGFPSIFGMVKGGLEWLGDKFQRPEAKQRAYDAIMGSLDDQGYGTYKGNQYRIVDSPTGKKIYSEVNPFGKNFDSMFGSKSVEEMDQKTLDWAMNRVNAGKAISQRLRDILTKRGMLGSTQVDERITDTIVSPTDGPAPRGPVTTGGGGTFAPAFDRGHPGATPTWHGATRERGQTFRDTGGTQGQVAGPGFGKGAYWADGGRVGLYGGGDPGAPEFAEDDLTTIEFMQDQGVPYGDMASAVDPMDALNDMSMEVFGKPLHQLTGEEYQMLIDMANEQASGPQEEIVEEGIASLV